MSKIGSFHILLQKQKADMVAPNPYWPKNLKEALCQLEIHVCPYCGRAKIYQITNEPIYMDTSPETRCGCQFPPIDGMVKLKLRREGK